MWKKIFINNIETYYEANEEGFIRNGNTKHILKPKQGYNGYYHLTLYINTIKTDILVHRVIAETFISNPHNLSTVNHIDGNKTNNNIENLEWSSYSNNSKHAWKNGLNHSTNNRPVLQYTLQGEFIAEYASCAEAKRITGAAKVNEVANGKRNSSGGYLWKFKNEEEYIERDNRSRKCAQYTLDGTLIKIYDSISEAARQTGLNRVGINSCCNRKTKTSKGFIWKTI